MWGLLLLLLLRYHLLWRLLLWQSYSFRLGQKAFNLFQCWLQFYCLFFKELQIVNFTHWLKLLFLLLYLFLNFLWLLNLLCNWLFLLSNIFTLLYDVSLLILILNNLSALILSNYLRSKLQWLQIVLLCSLNSVISSLALSVPDS